jgi:hypothetical protein
MVHMAKFVRNGVMGNCPALHAAALATCSKRDMNEAARAADACAWVEPTVVALI